MVSSSVRGCDAVQRCRGARRRDEGRARHGRSVRATLTPVSARPPTRVSLVALPEAMPSTLIGLHDVLSSVGTIPTLRRRSRPRRSRSRSSAERAGPMPLVTGVPVTPARTLDEVDATDIVLVPSILAEGGRWERGRYPGLVDWIARMHAGGALLVLRVLGAVPARRDRPHRRAGGHDPLGLRRRLPRGLPGGRARPREGAGGERRPVRHRHLGRLVVVGRPGALPDRPARRARPSPRRPPGSSPSSGTWTAWPPTPSSGRAPTTATR